MFSEQLRRDFCAKTVSGTLTAAVLTVGSEGEREGEERTVRSQSGVSQDSGVSCSS